jgi:hypothetical protein
MSPDSFQSPERPPDSNSNDKTEVVLFSDPAFRIVVEPELDDPELITAAIPVEAQLPPATPGGQVIAFPSPKAIKYEDFDFEQDRFAT